MIRGKDGGGGASKKMLVVGPTSLILPFSLFLLVLTVYQTAKMKKNMDPKMPRCVGFAPASLHVFTPFYILLNIIESENQYIIKELKQPSIQAELLSNI